MARPCRTPRGLRNCNPLNIRYVKGNTWLGCFGSDGAFCKFRDRKHGLRAAFVLLRIYNQKHQKWTIREIISRWAPENENHTENYIRRVCRYMGVKDDQVVKFGDPDYQEMGCKMVAAMSVVENGKDVLTCHELKEAWAFAFGEKGGEA